MNTPNTEEARELLKRLLMFLQCDGTVRDHTIIEARDYLKRHEPKHPAVVAFEEWWSTDMESRAESDGLTYREVAQPAALHFFRKGLEAAAEMVCGHKEAYDGCPYCDTHQCILNASKEVPSE